MNYLDNPQQHLTQLAAAWELYETDLQAQIEKDLSSIVTWRWATDGMFRSHPLFGQADTTPNAEPWRPFTRRWLADNGSKANFDDGCKHGLDADGRIILEQRQWYSHITLWREGFCDRLFVEESPDEADVFSWGSSSQDRAEFTRFWRDSNGRIACIGECLREYEFHYRELEWFKYEGKQCIESVHQSFEIMTEIPHYAQDKSDEELRTSYRPLDGGELVGNLVELMFSRKRVKYDYGPAGDLIKAEAFRADRRPVDGLLFQKLAERPLEEAMQELASKTTDAILKAVKKRSPAKPYRAVALIYSAEHAHCGLPHEVRLLGHDRQWPKERFSFESYPDELDVAFKRPVIKLLTEFNQRCAALFNDEFEGEVEATMSVMRAIAEKLHRELAGAKHVSDDFAVVVIDDHGDVEGFSLPVN